MSHGVPLPLKSWSTCPRGCFILQEFNQRVNGLTMKTQTRGAHTANATDTRSGLTIVTALISAPDDPKLEMIWTMTRPTTSSIMAALVSTTPSRDVIRPVDRSTVNVVPRLVEHSAAPAANAWRGVAPLSFWRTKERPMGTVIPVMATHEDSQRLALRAPREVDRPPVLDKVSLCRLRNDGVAQWIFTFIYQKQQSKIAQLDNNLLSFCAQPFGSGRSPGYSYEYLPKEATVDTMIEHKIGDVEEKKKGRLNKDCDDSWLVVRKGGCHCDNGSKR